MKKLLIGFSQINMKKIMLLTIVFILCNLSFSQITTTEITDKKKEISNQPYDSLENFLGNEVYKYIGQEFYLKGKSERLRKYGYDGFLTDYTKSKYREKDVVYKCDDSYSSKYDDLVGRYFSVIAVHNPQRILNL